MELLRHLYRSRLQSLPYKHNLYIGFNFDKFLDMTNEPYSNREIDSLHKAVDEKLDLILAQTTKHNGRLSRVEQKVWMITGGLAVVAAIVVPLFLDLLK